MSDTFPGLLVTAFAPAGPLILGLDETFERRRGPKIQARAISRDLARSSRAYFQKTSGLRWLPPALTRGATGCRVVRSWRDPNACPCR